MKKLFLLTFIILIIQGCGIYSFTGISTTAESFQVNFFQNNAPIVEPGLGVDFRNTLQDQILNQTNMALLTSNAQLIYEGEIVEYRVSPMSATAQNTAAQNRLTIGVNVRFYDNKNPDDDFERKFSFFFDFPAATQLNAIKSQAHEEIFERIIQDVFNESLAKW